MLKLRHVKKLLVTRHCYEQVDIPFFDLTRKECVYSICIRFQVMCPTKTPTFIMVNIGVAPILSPKHCKVLANFHIAACFHLLMSSGGRLLGCIFSVI